MQHKATLLIPERANFPKPSIIIRINRANKIQPNEKFQINVVKVLPKKQPPLISLQLLEWQNPPKRNTIPKPRNKPLDPRTIRFLPQQVSPSELSQNQLIKR